MVQVTAHGLAIDHAAPARYSGRFERGLAYPALGVVLGEDGSGDDLRLLHLDQRKLLCGVHRLGNEGRLPEA